VALPEWMPDQQVSYTRLFLEDVKSFGPKYMLTMEQHLRGISVWVLGTEDPEVWNVLKRKPGQGFIECGY
jgi:spore germination protein YaaH